MFYNPIKINILVKFKFGLQEVIFKTFLYMLHLLLRIIAKLKH